MKLYLQQPRFNPKKLSTLASWINIKDINTITKDGSDLVSAVANKGSAGNAVQATTANKPKYIANGINGRPAIQGRHDGTNASNLAIADSAALDYSTFTQFAVIQRVADLGASEHIAGKYAVTGNQREQRLTISIADEAAAAASPDGTSPTLAAVSVAGAIPVGTPIILCSYFDGANLKVQKNLGTPGSVALTSVFNGTSPFYLLSRDGNAEPFAGLLGEHIFCNGILPARQITQIIRYLKSGWGIS